MVADDQSRRHQGAVTLARTKLLGAARGQSDAQKATMATGDNPNRTQSHTLRQPHAIRGRDTWTRYLDAVLLLPRGRLRHSIAPRRKRVVVHQGGREPAQSGNDNSDKHCQGEPSAAATAKRYERIGSRDTNGHGGKRDNQRQYQRHSQNNQRYICKRVTLTRTIDQFLGHGRNPTVRITLVSNMAMEPGTDPARLRRRFWRTAANVWRMVKRTLVVLSLSRAVAETTHAAPGEEI